MSQNEHTRVTACFQHPRSPFLFHLAVTAEMSGASLELGILNLAQMESCARCCPAWLFPPQHRDGEIFHIAVYGCSAIFPITASCSNTWANQFAYPFYCWWVFGSFLLWFEAVTNRTAMNLLGHVFWGTYEQIFCLFWGVFPPCFIEV